MRAVGHDTEVRIRRIPNASSGTSSNHRRPQNVILIVILTLPIKGPYEHQRVKYRLHVNVYYKFDVHVY